MATNRTQNRRIISWRTLTEIASTLIFLVAVTFIEYLIVLYAQSLGVTEATEHRVFGAVSPLFHLVPAAAIIALTFSWKYLTWHIAVKPEDTVKKRGKRGISIVRVAKKPQKPPLRSESFAFVRRKTANACVKSGLAVLSLFAIVAFSFSLLAYPRLIYEAVADSYRGNGALLDFVKGTAQALSPVFVFFSAVGKTLIPLAPAFRNFVLAVGVVFNPLANLDAAGKYVAFQNAAAWISGMIVLFYGAHLQKWRRHRTARKS